jgi:hypothetical protein
MLDWSTHFDGLKGSSKHPVILESERFLWMPGHKELHAKVALRGNHSLYSPRE